MSDDREQLGDVTAPSGILLVLDFGLLCLWSHDREPILDPDLLPPDIASIAPVANSASDFRVEGPDAEAAGRTLGRQRHSRYVYDIPDAEELRRSFLEVVRREGLAARLRRIDRVPHRRRVDQAVAAGISTVQYHGMSAVALGKQCPRRAVLGPGDQAGRQRVPRLLAVDRRRGPAGRRRGDRRERQAHLIRAIEGLGCVFVRHGGKHDWYRNPATGVSQSVPRHREERVEELLVGLRGRIPEVGALQARGGLELLALGPVQPDAGLEQRFESDRIDSSTRPL